MRCAICQSDDSIVLRTDAGEYSIRRRRECCQCRHRWTTYESMADAVEELNKIKDLVRPLAGLVE